MTFDDAVHQLAIGNKVRRLMWPDEMYICQCHFDDERPTYCLIQNNVRETYCKVQEDLDANDWYIIQ